MAAGANERGADDLACRLAHHAASARRRAEEERQVGNQDAVIFLLSLAVAIEHDARRVRKANRWKLIGRWVAVVIAVLAGMVAVSIVL